MPNSNDIINSSNAATPLPLLSDEQVIFLTRPSFIITLFFIVVLLSVGGALLYLIINSQVLNSITFVSPMILIGIYVAVFLFVALIIFLSWLNTEYLLTNKRVEMRFGIVSSGTFSIALNNIQSVSVNIGVIGFILNFGTITIEPAGIVRRIVFGSIPHPKIRAEQIESARIQ